MKLGRGDLCDVLSMIILDPYPEYLVRKFARKPKGRQAYGLLLIE